MRSSVVRGYAPFLRYSLLVAACAATVTACGSASSGPSAGAGSPAGSSAAAPKVSLSITVSSAPGSPAQHWTLTCDPVGGTHPDPAAACEDLFRVKTPFADQPQPKGLACPMILASSKEVTIKGTYFGQPVNTTLRDGGCQLSRWAQLGQIIN
jgi:Subtilisin inhibitor-like